MSKDLLYSRQMKENKIIGKAGYNTQLK